MLKSYLRRQAKQSGHSGALSAKASLLESAPLQANVAQIDMDFSAVDAIKHDVAVKTINVRHLVEVSPDAVAIFREIRFCVLALCASWATVTVIRSWRGQERGTR